MFKVFLFLAISFQKTLCYMGRTTYSAPNLLSMHKRAQKRSGIFDSKVKHNISSHKSEYSGFQFLWLAKVLTN